ncbi:hypothetical protein K8I61_07615 [bacterium]|nr:hypothetical protein [bacterium]
MNRQLPFLMALFLILVVSAAYGLGCGDDDDDDDDAGDDDDDDDDDDDGECPTPNLDLAVCAPENGPFTTDIDNDFLPFQVGMLLVLEGEDDGESIRVEVEVLDETEEVAGVTTRVVTETEYEDGELVEISFNFFAQAPDGTVCYFGEDVDDYEDGEIVGHEGAWRAGEADYEAGILMPGTPEIGQAFYQEYAPGTAEDSSEITAFGESVSTPAGDFDDTLTAMDYDPLDGECEGERKVYARGIGNIVDEAAVLVEFTVK